MLTRLITSALLILTLTAFAAARQSPGSADSTPAAAQSSTASASKKPANKAAAKKTSKRTAAKGKLAPAKAARMKRAFVASANLRVMARQLIENRTPAAFNGVQDYARRHAGSDAGALAWLSVGYGHVLEQQYPQAIVALEKATPRAGELADYVRFYSALSYSAENNSAKTIELLRNFDGMYPESVLCKDVVVVYGTALVAQGRVAEAAAYLEQHRTPISVKVELALGRAYLRSEHPEKGMEILRHLYFTMPTSAEADDAAQLLSSNGASLTGSFADQRTRAEVLLKAGRVSDAIHDYRQLLSSAQENERGGIAIALAGALRKSNPGEERRLLDQYAATGEAQAQRLYLLGELARNDGNEALFEEELNQLRQFAPQSSWLQQELLSAANMYLLEKNYDRAIDSFRELQQRFPSSDKASYAHWKAAWLNYRQGRTEIARQDFEDQVKWYPDRGEVPAALYWRARIAEDEHDYATARAWYGKLGANFQNYYYGILGRERLAQLGAHVTNASLTDNGVLAQLPAIKSSGAEAMETEPPASQLRAEKARLLVNAGLNEFAIRELQAEQGGQGARWSTLMIARIYDEAGDHHKAIQFLKRSLPGYYSVDLAALPRPYWEILFPRPYWSEVQRHAAANGLDPYLVASLIRQESEFNPAAISHANAYGLMQLLPKVGKDEARAAHIRHFNTAQLLTPAINIQLGTHYFKEMIANYNGGVEYALAAYNAGSNRVDEWRETGHFRDIPEFVESIPFTETREYVQAIMRNAKVYEKLYPKQ